MICGIVQLKYVDPSHMNVMFFNLTNDTWMDFKYWIKPILVAYISGWFDDVLLLKFYTSRSRDHMLSKWRHIITIAAQITSYFII